MKRLTLLVACLGATAWFSGCCHSHYGKCVGWNDADPYSCGASDCCEEESGCRDKFRLRHSKRHKHGSDCCCQPTDCCGPNYGVTTGGAMYGASEGGVVEGGFVSGMPAGAGCGGCAGGTSGMPTSSGGCASGNCGSGQTVSGNMFDPGSGWTIMPTPMQSSGEPTPAPPSGSGAIAPIPAPTTSPAPAPASAMGRFGTVR